MKKLQAFILVALLYCFSNSQVQETEARLDRTTLSYLLDEFTNIQFHSPEQLKSLVSGTTLVSTSELNVRSTPCTSGSVITTIPQNTLSRYMGEEKTDCGYTWLKISGTGYDGWAASNFLKKIDTPVAGTTLYATDTVNVRASPCTTGDIRGSLSVGQTVRGTGRETVACGFHWWSIQGTFGDGWVANLYVSTNNNSGQCRVRNYPLFKQCDSRWAQDRLGRDSTICAVGCLMSSVSMSMNGLGKKINGADATPRTLNSFLLSNGGYQGNLYVWGAISRFGYSYEGQPENPDTIARAVCDGKVVILQIDRGAHWVLAVGVNGRNFLINDPGRTRNSVPYGEVLRAGVYSVK